MDRRGYGQDYILRDEVDPFTAGRIPGGPNDYESQAIIEPEGFNVPRNQSKRDSMSNYNFGFNANE